MKIEIFNSETTFRLQQSIDKWLLRNPDINIVRTHASESMGKNQYGSSESYTFYILYEEKSGVKL